MTAPDTPPSRGMMWTRHGPVVDLGGTHTIPAGPGSILSIAVTGTRCCPGWAGPDGRRIVCSTHRGPDSTVVKPQCGSCALRESLHHPTRIAKPRVFWVYLAWHGDTIISAGVTTARFAVTQLAERGALAYTVIGAGPKATAHIAAHAIAEQDITSRATTCPPPRWWHADPSVGRRQLHAAAAAAAEVAATVPRLTLHDIHIIDQTARLGLDTPPPRTYRNLIAITDRSILFGHVHAAAGTHLLVNTTEGNVLCDTRLLSGWPLSLTEDPQLCLHLGPPHRIRVMR